MSTRPDKQIIELIAREMATDEAFVEKDWHGVQVIAAIAALSCPGYEFIFAGGTALAKAHHLIQRFSEDIDFRLHPAGHTPNRAALSALKTNMLGSLRTAGFVIEEDSIVARNGNKYFTFNIRYEKQFAHSALRPNIKVEVTLDSPKLAVFKLSVSSLFAIYSKQPAEVTSIACLSYVENAADKLSATVWRIPARVRGSANDDPTLVRHLHDLACLKSTIADHPQFAELCRATIIADSERSEDREFTSLPPEEKCARMVAILETDPLYATEYRLFVAGLSYASAEATPDFASALSAIRELVKLIL